MAETAVTILVELLAQPIVEEIKLLRGAGEGLDSLRQDLEAIQAFLKEADKRQRENETVKDWVKKVRKAAYDIEDVVDQFLYCIQRPSGHGFFGFLRKRVRFARQLKARHRIASKVQYHESQLKDINESAKAFSFAEASSSDAQGSGRRPRITSFFVEESQIVGIDQPRENMIEQLITERSKFVVISVHGMAGVGKTTLVTAVCKDQRVKNHFGCPALVTVVSKPLQLKKLFKSMIKQLRLPDQHLTEFGKRLIIAGEDEAPLASTIREYLCQKRYLIFLDNVSSNEDWDSIKCAFPDDDPQSRIIVTTRYKNVALHCSRDVANVHMLDSMPQEAARTLLCNNAFGAETGDGCPPELMDTSERILEVCGNLPLVIVAIGGLLSTKRRSLVEWEGVLSSLRPEIEANESLEPMKKILWLSYDELPYHLKPCFLYFGTLPVDYNIKRSKITRLWIAEGFIKPMPNQSLEKTAEGYLNELVQRNLVQAVKSDCYGRVRRCRVHSFMHELVLLACREQNFHSIWSENNSGMDEKVRRLAVHARPESLPAGPRFSHLRSLLLLGANQAPQTSSFRFLRVLHLKGVPLESFPEEILGLFNLRYLHLRKTKIEELPKAIWKLQNLQSLDLKRTPVSKLPNEIIQLKNLRHILVYKEVYHGVVIPEKIGTLTALQKLAHVNITGGAAQLKELSKLSQLKRLCITKLGSDDGEALCNSIRNMSQLESLYLNPGLDQEQLNIESLPVASPFLRSINLRGRLHQLPDSVQLFKSLEKLRLNFSKLNDDPFLILQRLPSLVELNMHNDAYDGEELRSTRGFLKLAKLHIHNFHPLRRLVIDEGAMPNLDLLEILNCQNFERVPAGIEHLKKLNELYVGLVSEDCLRRLTRNEGEDWEKVKHIPFIKKIFQEDGRFYQMDL